MELIGSNEKSTFTLTPAEVCEAVFKHLNTQYHIPKESSGLILAVKVKKHNMPSIVITFDTDINNIKPVKKAAEYIKCIRCGVCCILAPCDGDKLDKTGICLDLTIHKKGYTSCKYFEEKENFFGRGCFLRRPKELYKYHKKEAEIRIGRKLIGIV